MPSKKFEELNAMTPEELQAELQETETFLQKLKFDHAIKGLENPLAIRNVRRDIARIKTEQRRRELADASPEVLANRSKIRQRRRRK